VFGVLKIRRRAFAIVEKLDFESFKFE